jgi:hypothetical protein
MAENKKELELSSDEEFLNHIKSHLQKAFNQSIEAYGDSYAVDRLNIINSAAQTYINILDQERKLKAFRNRGEPQ